METCGQLLLLNLSHSSYFLVQIPSEVFLLSHLRGKKHREKVAENKGTGITEEELVSRCILDAHCDHGACSSML